MENFVVRHYSEDAMPTIKGNGFDGLEIVETREEAEEFIDFVNKAMDFYRKCHESLMLQSRKAPAKVD